MGEVEDGFIIPEQRGNYPDLQSIWDNCKERGVYQAIDLESGEAEVLFCPFHEELDLWIGKDDEGLFLFNEEGLDALALEWSFRVFEGDC